MKAVIALLLSIIACFGCTNAAPQGAGRDCPLFCPGIFYPVCGYDGTCYQQFANQCQYEAAKCNFKSNLETVDKSLCDLAVKDNHPNYKICT